MRTLQRLRRGLCSLSVLVYNKEGNMKHRKFKIHLEHHKLAIAVDSSQAML